MAKVSADFDYLLKDAFTRSFQLALKEAHAGSEWIMQSLADDKLIKKDEAYVLTVASLLFRVVVVFHFNFDSDMKQFVAGAGGSSQDKLDDERALDFIAEIGNCFCGALKRELQVTVNALGMSTPNRLDHASLKYLRSLKLDGEGHVAAKLGEKNLFSGSYYLSAYGDLNYAKSYSAQASTDVGELEMF